MSDSIDTRIERLKSIRDGYENDLLNDAVTGTQPDYSVEGRSVSRNAWRDSLRKAIADIDDELARLEPFEFHQQAW